MAGDAELRQQALERGDRRSSLVFYRFVRAALALLVNPWLRLTSENAEILDRPGATILAPVHRSHLDSALIATQSRRRLRALGKQSLFTTPGVSWVCAALGAIPVKRGQADRDALSAALSLLERGETIFVFPEGGRRQGNEIGELFDDEGSLVGILIFCKPPLVVYYQLDRKCTAYRIPGRGCDGFIESIGVQAVAIVVYRDQRLQGSADIVEVHFLRMQ